MKECNQCGKCCIKYGGGDLSATKEEIDLWEIFNPEIYKLYLNNYKLNDFELFVYFLINEKDKYKIYTNIGFAYFLQR